MSWPRLSGKISGVLARVCFLCERFSVKPWTNFVTDDQCSDDLGTHTRIASDSLERASSKARAIPAASLARRDQAGSSWIFCLR